MAETGFTWIDCLPLVMLNMQMLPSVKGNIPIWNSVWKTPSVSHPTEVLRNCSWGRDVGKLHEKYVNNQISYVKGNNMHWTNRGGPLEKVGTRRLGIRQDHQEESGQALGGTGHSKCYSPPTAVRIAERPTWVHVTHCKRVKTPLEQREKEQGFNDGWRPV